MLRQNVLAIVGNACSGLPIRLCVDGAHTAASGPERSEERIVAALVPDFFGNVADRGLQSGGIVGNAPVGVGVVSVFKLRSADSDVVWSRGDTVHGHALRSKITAGL